MSFLRSLVAGIRSGRRSDKDVHDFEILLFIGQDGSLKVFLIGEVDEFVLGIEIFKANRSFTIRRFGMNKLGKGRKVGRGTRESDGLVGREIDFPDHDGG